jgi:class 3 adenylate cyclase/predicted ATPase
VTVVFCDVVGSTALGDSRDPEALELLLARYFERMRSIVERHGGTVEKFIGDAVVAVFGVPVVHEDDALRALRAAVEMRDALPELGVAARLGVNTGEIVTSGHGTLVTGDAINVAARLQQTAAAGEVLIGERTVALAGSAVTVEDLEPLELKGKAEPEPAFRLLSVGEAPERSHESRFVGRADELAFLEAAWDHAVEGERCELVTVVGEPGVGKSRLIAEFTGAIDARVVQGRCLSYGQGITYYPVIGVVKQLGAVAAGADVAATIESLVGASDAASSPDEIAWAFRKLLEAAAGELPLVVVFDDVQWGEETFLDLVEHVALFSSGAPLLILCLARPELNERRPHWPGSLRLGPLPASEVEELLPTSVPESLRRRIAHAAGGNPLFVTEMVAMAEEAADEVVVPPTLKALLAARIDRLEGGERGVLERGAVEGEVFHRGSVQALTEAGSPVTPQLSSLVRRELIRPSRAILPGEDAFRFCHLLVRDAAYDALPKTIRAELHERFADWLDHHGSELATRDEIAGYHLEQACRYHRELGDPDEVASALGERAAAHLARAGQRAATRGDHHAFVALVERALELGIADPNERVWLQTELGPPLREIGRIADARAVLLEAEDSALAIGNRAAAALAAMHQQQVNMAWVGHDLGEHEQVCRRALATFAEGDDQRLLALAALQLAFVLENQDRWEEAGGEMGRALVYADACGDQAVRRGVIGRYVSMAFLWGPTPAREMTARCEELLATTDSDWVLDALLKRCLGVTYAMAGRADEALALAGESSAVLDELNQALYSYLYRLSVAYARELAGDLPGAERELLACWSYFSRPGFPGTDRRKVLAAYELASFYCDEGRFEEAEQLDLPHSDLPLTGPTVLDHSILRQSVEARLAARAGRADEAVALAEDAVARSAARGRQGRDRPQQTARAWLALAEVQRSAGRHEHAERSVARAIELYELKGNLAAAARTRATIPS